MIESADGNPPAPRPTNMFVPTLLLDRGADRGARIRQNHRLIVLYCFAIIMTVRMGLLTVSTNNMFLIALYVVLVLIGAYVLWQRQRQRRNEALVDLPSLVALQMDALQQAAMAATQNMRIIRELQQTGVSEKGRAAFETVLYVRDPSGSADACSICLDEYDALDRLYRLPCGHVFHQPCIDTWVANHTQCPLCNQDLDLLVGEAEGDATAPSAAAADQSVIVIAAQPTANM